MWGEKLNQTWYKGYGPFHKVYQARESEGPDNCVTGSEGYQTIDSYVMRDFNEHLQRFLFVYPFYVDYF